jgi:hypothetical protein
VRGFRRLPVPPARTTPFIFAPLNAFCGDGRRGRQATLRSVAYGEDLPSLGIMQAKSSLVDARDAWMIL